MPIILESSAANVAVTANDIIERAYRLLGDLGTGESMTAHQAADGLNALNGMLDLFSVEPLMIYVLRQEALSWTINTASMTIGSGADLDTNRPVKIEKGTYFKDASGYDYPVDIIRSREAYDGNIDKTVASSYPELLYYQPTVTWGTIYLYPVPNQALTLYLNSWEPLQYFDTLSEAISLPPGYRTMIEYNLAVFLEAETGLVLPPGARMIADNAKSAIKRHNNSPIYSKTDCDAVLNSYGSNDIEAGE